MSRWPRHGLNGAETLGMPGSWPESEFPYLNSTTCTITSGASRKYNCLAWAAGENHQRWEPDLGEDWYWPPGVPRELTFPAFVLAYSTLGFNVCFSSALEEGMEKIAIFGIERSGVKVPTHAALQLETGSWTSKLGDFEDIEHPAVDAVSGPIYGRPIVYMQRPRPSTNI